jgi:hypothetical protein
MYNYLNGYLVITFSTVFKPALGSGQSPISWVQGIFPPEIKQPEHEADHSPPSSAEAMNGGSVPSLSHVSPLLHHGVILN